MQAMLANYGTMLSPADEAAGQQKPVRGFCGCCNCCVAVPQDRYYSVERFGEFKRILGPGYACIGFDCCGLCIGYRSISRRVEQNTCVVETKTRDNVFVAVHVAVQQSVSPDRAEAAIYRLASVGAQIDSYVADVVRSHLPTMSLDEAFEKKDNVCQAIQENLAEHMKDYGFVIHQALVTEIRPNREVMDAMNEINKQKRLRDATAMAAEAEKLRVVKAAEAQADAAHLQGEGIARQRSAIVRGLRESITEGTDDKLTSDKISELLLISQYFETLKEIGGGSRAQAIFVPHSPGDGIADIAGQIRQGVLESRVPDLDRAAAQRPPQRIMA